MSFMDCINAKVAAGVIQKGRADALQKKYDALAEKYSSRMGDVMAAATAAERVVSVELEQIAAKNRNKVVNALSQQRLYNNVKQNLETKRAAYDKLKPWQKAFWPEPTVDKEINDILESTYHRTQSVMQQHVRQLADFIEQYSSKAAGLKQETKGIRDVIKAVLDEDIADPALAKLGKDIRGVFDSLHTRFRNAGGIIGKINNYFPQTHQAEKVRASDPKAWADFIRPLLDRERMINPETGVAYTDMELEVFLAGAYKEISTNGLDEFQRDIAEGVAPQGMRDIASRQNKRRSIHFKDADSFLAYNDKFGVGEAGLYEAIIGKISVMSREIGIMEKLSPNANAYMNYAEAFMQSKGVNKTRINNTKGQYDVLSGRLAGTGNEGVFYKALMGYQNLHRAAVLGSAPISALSDGVFTYMAARANGMSGVQAVKRQLSLLNPANAADRRHIERSLFVAQSSLGSGYQAARMADEISGGGKFVNTTRAISGVTHRMSGLAHITEATMNAAALEVSGFMAEMTITKTPWESLSNEVRAAMIANGIRKNHYSQMIAATPSEFEGATFLRAEDIMKTGANEAAQLFDDWLIKTRALAANEPTLQTRAITTGAAFGDAAAGTFLRGFTSSVMMYKGFSITMFNNYFRPALANAAVGRPGDLGVLVVGSTLLGAVAMQLKEMLKGREPKDMEDPRFWKAAMLQGGGMGFYGEFLFKEVNGYGRNLQTELMGPVFGTVNDVQKIMFGNFDKAYDDKKDSNFMRDIGNLTYRHIPGQSLWYGRLVMERYVKDTFNRMTDSNYDAKIKRAEKQLKNDTGQGYWFRPGSALPLGD